jgi:ribosomal protein S18 acetylase RimI-like enzyme
MTAGNELLQKVMLFMGTVRKSIFSRKKFIIYKYSVNELRTLGCGARRAFTYRPLARDDYPALEKLLTLQKNEEIIFKPFFDITEAQNRLDNDGSCFICEDNGKIVGYVWFAFHEQYIPELGKIMSLPDKGVYAYNSYVKKSYRGNNIVSDLLITASRELYVQGFTDSIRALTIDWNMASRTLLKNLGFSEEGYFLAGHCCFIPYVIKKMEKM